MKQCNHCGYYCSDITVNCPECASINEETKNDKKLKIAIHALEWIKRNRQRDANVQSIIQEAFDEMKKIKLHLEE